MCSVFVCHHWRHLAVTCELHIKCVKFLLLLNWILLFKIWPFYLKTVLSNKAMHKLWIPLKFLRLSMRIHEVLDSFQYSAEWQLTTNVPDYILASLSYSNFFIYVKLAINHDLTWRKGICSWKMVRASFMSSVSSKFSIVMLLKTEVNKKTKRYRNLK